MRLALLGKGFAGTLTEGCETQEIMIKILSTEHIFYTFVKPPALFKPVAWIISY